MTCRELVDFVMSYLEGELPAETTLAFEDHLAECPGCVRFLEQYRFTLGASRAAFDERDEAAPLPDELVLAILGAAKRKS